MHRKGEDSVIHIRVDQKTKSKWHMAVKIAASMDKRAGDLFKEMLEYYTSRVPKFTKIEQMLKEI